MPTAFRRDDRAVTDLPLRLLITVVILAIAVPATFGAMTKFARDSSEREAASALTSLRTSGNQVLTAGPGTRVSVTLDVSGAMLGKLERAVIGANLTDPKDAVNGTVMWYRVDGRETRTIVTGDVCFMAHLGEGTLGPTVLLPGKYTLSLTHEAGSFTACRQGSYVGVRVLGS